MTRFMRALVAVAVLVGLSGPAKAQPIVPVEGRIATGYVDAPVADPTTRPWCRLVAVQQDTMTGQSFEGALDGVAVDAGRYPWFRCFVAVNGSEVLSTAVSNVPGLVADRATYAAGETDVAEVCVEVGTMWTYCRPVTVAPIWSDVELDPQGHVNFEPVDGLVCPVISIFPGAYGPVTITGDGDVFVTGEWVYDCPPYEFR